MFTAGGGGGGGGSVHLLVNSGGGGCLLFAYAWGIAAEPVFEFGEAKLEVSSEIGSTVSECRYKCMAQWSIAQDT